ncbi:MAG: isoaspartyl peptidase/L-asparaginase [Isosphaeraceae bacterium]|nr:isoaspartyl peptidase/L-asparaginase [Isosphaeraceae bacterium]
MTPRIHAVVLLSAFLAVTARGDEPPAARERIVLVVHGGSGVRPRSEMAPAREQEYRRVLTEALRAGHQALGHTSRSVDAVEAAIRVMEDSSLFNAGKGAVFNHDGRNELDASIMEGREKRAGAVANVTRIKNPISAARAVMERSAHVLLIGDGAERFAFAQHLREVSPVYFWTPERWEELQKALHEEQAASPAPGAAKGGETDHPFGTVGAVALDPAGNLAAGTSTGGMTNKRYGRVGDSPIIGAGTYADNSTCAVSCTGHGEVFIRNAVAHDIVARMKYGKRSLGEAAREALRALPSEPGGVGGMIALDARGNAIIEFDTEGMYRGQITESGAVTTAIYREP